MAEIEITLPTVQYGNVKVKATPEELGLDSVADAAALGVASAVYLSAFTQGFQRGAKIDVDIDDSMAHAGSGPYKGVTEAQAQRYLNEGLGGVTEIEENQYDRKHEVLSAGLNDYNDDGPGDVQAAANEARDAAPWDNPQVDAKPKPWEGGRLRLSAKPVVDEGW